ncbi:MAG: metallophosphoesterase [Verrucomicrobiia bacterium]
MQSSSIQPQLPAFAPFHRTSDALLADGLHALVEPQEGWMAISDLHYGYEISQHANGALYPAWGMSEIEARLLQLFERHQPRTLILVGDIVHNTASLDEARALLQRLRRSSLHVIAIAGNHDRHVERSLGLEPFALVRGTLFHHGHLEGPEWKGRSVVGHWHPALALRSGNGPTIRLPAFVRSGRQWILPAFSPWTNGTPWLHEVDESYVCTNAQTLPLPTSRGA